MLNLTCPICHTPLQREANALRCENNHSFDYARRGYVNLLPVQFRRSKQPGDDAGMVQARAQFLERGFYQPVAAKLVDLLTQLCSGKTRQCIDIGCGEGYNTRKVAAALPLLQIVALDISKAAVHAACVGESSIEWLVASNAHLPVADSSIDLAWTLFTPLQTNELSRVLKPEGTLIVVGAGEQHLIELRQKIYDDVRMKPFALPAALDSWQREDHVVGFKFEVDNNALQQLLQMTPHFWRVAPAKKAPLLELPHLSLTADIVFSVLRH